MDRADLAQIADPLMHGGKVVACISIIFVMHSTKADQIIELCADQLAVTRKKIEQRLAMAHSAKSN